jgi:alkanesulfonate monooxygenase SsuD/methylene tetrahydromethanopterin reductase-like flavin-dependent oxidoreductase (luciferase family)
MNPQFGFELKPTVHVTRHRELVAAAEELGLDLVAVHDHPYAPTMVETFAVIGDLLARTERLRFFTDVATLPLRPPAMLAKASAALDLLSGGRFELGLGAGGVWDGIAGMGVAPMTPGESLDALEEAIGLIRRLWRPRSRVVAEGKYYGVDVNPGPAPAHDIGIWLGSIGPRSLRLTGRLADGWAAPIPKYLPYDEWAGANAVIDKAAYEAGRDPAEVQRIAQVVGTITDRPGDTDTTTGAAPLRGTPDQWAAMFAELATEQPFRTFVFWPEHHTLDQVERFARDVVPATRALVAD